MRKDVCTATAELPRNNTNHRVHDTDPMIGDLVVIGDNQNTLALLTSMLKDKGHKVRIVNEVRSVPQAIQTQVPDLILLDLHLSELSDDAILDYLKPDTPLKPVPIMGISSLCAEDEVARAFQLGCVDYISKPFRKEEVYSRIDTHLRLKHTQEELKETRKELENRVDQRTAELKVAHTALQKDEAELKAIYQNAPLLMLLVDRERRIIKMNEAALSMAGRSMSEVVGLHGGEALRCVHAYDDPQGCGFGQACQDCGIRNAVLETFRTRQPVHSREAFIPCRHRDKVVDMVVSVSTSLLHELADDLLLVCLQDITARKLTERALHQSEDKFKSVVRDLPGLICRNKPNGTIVYVNDAYCRFFSKTLDELVGHDFYSLLPESDRQLVRDNLATLSADHPKLVHEHRVIAPDGSIRYHRWTNRAICDEQGKVTIIQAYGEDITERMRTEKALRESEAKMKSIFRAAPIGIGIVSNRVLLDVNERFCAMLHYAKHELVGSNARFLYLSDEDYEYVGKEKYRQIKAQGTGTVETRWRRKDGQIIDVLLSSTPLNPNDLSAGITFTALDITERKRAEKQVQIEKRFTDTIIQSLPGLFYFFEKENIRFVRRNDEFVKITGYSAEEVDSMTALDFFAEGEDRDLCARRMQDTYTNGTSSMENRLLTKSGEKIPYYFTGKRIVVDGKMYLVGLALDISEQKRMELELRRLRNYLSNIINSMPSVLIGVDTDGKVTQWNRTAEAYTAIPVAMAQGKPLAEVFPRMAAEMDMITRSIQTREIEQRQKRPFIEGDQLHYEDMTVYPLTGNGVEGAVIRIDDVTERVHMEEMMVQSEKMLSIGGLAAGMAHEINNPLAGMVQTAAVMANRLGDQDGLPANSQAAEAAGTTMDAIKQYMQIRSISRMLTAITESGQRVAGIVDNMLSFARKHETEACPHDLAALCDKTLELASTDYDLKKHHDFKQIHVQKAYESDLPSVSCEEAKIQQVILNILRNGAQAMHEKWHASNDREPGPCFNLRLTHERETHMVRMEIEDNGPGMDEATSKRIFEPFFTTKPVGEGTGLGLSVSYFIITKNHRGKLSVESRPGKGTTFIIRLPLERTNT